MSETRPDATVAAAVSFDDISRSFSGAAVLKGVTLQAFAGRTLALVGENGAGKSTLMNILGGNVPPERGQLRVAGQRYAPRTSQDARHAGIAFVHQELNLFPNLTVAENLHVQTFPRRGGLPWIDRRAMATRARTLLAQVGLTVAPETPLERLSAGERQLVEIAKAIGAQARVLILDEPTTSLSARERDRLFALMHDLRAQGLALIYISHDLADVLRLCDDVAVLRDGVVVAQGAARELTVERLVAQMIGRDVPQFYPPRRRVTRADAAGDPARLEVRGVSEPGIVRDVTFTLRRGEILGLFGVMGAGRSELARILFGLDPSSSGEVRLDRELLSGGPRQRQQRGLAFVTEDRRHDGLCLDASISDNIILTTLDACCATPARVVQDGRVQAAVRRMRDAVRLSPSARAEQPVRTLSGGNQQKVVLARWLLAEPRVLILDEPTRGVDVGARAEIYALIRELAERGAGVLLISSEIEELVGVSDRILVMRQGEVSAELVYEVQDATGRETASARPAPTGPTGQTGPHGSTAAATSRPTFQGFDRARMLTAALPDSSAPVVRPVVMPVVAASEDAASDGAASTLSAASAPGPAPVPGATARGSSALLRLLDLTPLLLLAAVLLLFGLQSDRFLTPDTLLNILLQSAPLFVVSTGMTFVLLTGGVDLSVGAVMFVGAAIAGRLALAGQPLALCMLVMIGVGLAGGAINALLVTRLRLVAFVATLATLYIGRGVGRWISETRALNLPDAFVALGSASLLGIPVPLWIAVVVLLLAEAVLTSTPFGRRLYAIGADIEAARKAGLETRRLLSAVYVIAGACAGLGGVLALAQLGAVSPKFGELYEFDAITAAVLGGTSLFGGRGRVLPGTALGVVLLKTIFSGLVMAQADPYLYPLITSAIIFAAVLLDSLRQRLRTRLARRVIRVEPDAAPAVSQGPSAS